MYNTTTSNFIETKLGTTASSLVFDSANKSNPEWTVQNPSVVLVDHLDEYSVEDIIKDSAVATLKSRVITTDQITQNETGYTQLMTSIGLGKEDVELEGDTYTQFQNMRGDSTEEVYYIVTEIEGEEPLKGSPVCGVLFVYSGSFLDGSSITDIAERTSYGLVGNELHRHVEGDKITYVHAIHQPTRPNASRYSDRVSITTKLDVYDQQANFKVNKCALLKDATGRTMTTTDITYRVNMFKDDGSGNRTPYTPTNAKPLNVSTAFGYDGYRAKADVNTDNTYEFKSIQLDDDTQSSDIAYCYLYVYSGDFYDLSRTHKLTIEGQPEAVILQEDNRTYHINCITFDKTQSTQEINLVWLPLAEPKKIDYKLNIMVEALNEATGEVETENPLFTDLLFTVRDGTNNLNYYPYYTKEPPTLTINSVTDDLNLKLTVMAPNLPDNLVYTTSFQSASEVTLDSTNGYMLPLDLDTTLSSTNEPNVVDVIIKTTIPDTNAPVTTTTTVEPKYAMKLRNSVGDLEDIPVDSNVTNLVRIDLRKDSTDYQLKEGTPITLNDDVRPSESPKDTNYVATVISIPTQSDTGTPYELLHDGTELSVGDSFDVPVQYVVGSTKSTIVNLELIGTKPLGSKTYTGSYTLDVHSFEQTDTELVDLGLNDSTASVHGITVDGTETYGGLKKDYSETLTEDKPAPTKPVIVSVTNPQPKTTYVLPDGVTLDSSNDYTHRFDLQLIDVGNDVKQTLTVTLNSRTQERQMVGIVRIETTAIRVDELGNDRVVPLSDVPYLESIMFHVGGSTMTASGFNATNDFYTIGYSEPHVAPMDMYPSTDIKGVDVLIDGSLITEANKHTFDVTYADIDADQIPSTVVPITLRIGGATGDKPVIIPRDFSAVITPIVTTAQYDNGGDLIYMGSGHPYVQTMEILVGDDVTTTFSPVVVTSTSTDFNPNGTITVAIKNPNSAFRYMINDVEGTTHDVDVLFDNVGNQRYVEIVIILP